MSEMSNRPYPSDLTDSEWELLQPLLPHPTGIGSPRRVDIRAVVNGILYVLDNGIKWRALPHDYPAWQTVYGYFYRWNQRGVWEQINTILSESQRVDSQRATHPTLGIIDSQSVRMSQKGGQSKGLTVING